MLGDLWSDKIAFTFNYVTATNSAPAYTVLHRMGENQEEVALRDDICSFCGMSRVKFGFVM